MVDPEIGISVVDLGLVYGVKIKNGKINVLMTFTSPTCPMAHALEGMVKARLMKIKDVKKMRVEITFDPAWTPERMSKKAKKILKI